MYNAAGIISNESDSILSMMLDWKSLITLIILMFLFLEIGRLFRKSYIAKKHSSNYSSIKGPVEKIIFGLFGLLLAFTFTGAGSRLENRRQLITVEARVIRTAYLRIALLPIEIQPQMRSLLKQYTLSRANIYSGTPTRQEAQSRFNVNEILLEQMWNITIDSCHKAGTPSYCATLMLPALNAIFDIRISRLMAHQTHPPSILYILLISLGLFSALLVGYDLPQSKRRNLLYMLGYAIIISVILYLIVDLEMPRQGLIRVDEADQFILTPLGNKM